jgi:plastocyanin
MVFLVNVACHDEEDISIVDRAFEPKNSGPNPMSIVYTWQNNGAEPHTTTDDIGLWDSGSIAPTGTFSQELNVAATYKYRCTFHPKKMRGTIAAFPFADPPATTEDAQVTVQWAFSDMFTEGEPPPVIPEGFNVDVQVRKPKADRYTTWLADQEDSETSGQYTVTKKGTYKFRSRIQNTATGDKSDWSPATEVTVTAPTPSP